MNRPADRRPLLHCRAMLVVTALCSLGGCGTVRTLDAVNAGAPLVFGGTRLNLDALADPVAARQRHRVAPPSLPMIDLPLSATLDVFMLPYTVGSALSRVLLKGGPR